MIHIEATGDKIVVTIDAGADEIRKARPSASGKSTIAATTGGFTSVDVDVDGTALAVSINLIKKG